MLKKVSLKFYETGGELTIVHQASFTTFDFIINKQPKRISKNILTDKKMNLVVSSLPTKSGMNIKVETNREGLYDVWMDGRQIIYKCESCEFGIVDLGTTERETSKPLESNSKVTMYSP